MKTSVKALPVTNGTFACARCGQGFKTKAATLMHFMRVHTRAGRKGAMWKRKKPGSTAHLWTKKQRIKFEKTMAARRILPRMSPERILTNNNQTPEHLEDPRDYINFCPGCGESLIEHYLAAGVAKRRRG